MCIGGYAGGGGGGGGMLVGCAWWCASRAFFGVSYGCGFWLFTGPSSNLDYVLTNLSYLFSVIKLGF